VTRRLLLTYLSLAVVVLAALEIPLGLANAHNTRQDLTQKVERDAAAIASLAESTVEGDSSGNLPAIRALARRYTADTGSRVVIVDARGTALVDSSSTLPAGRDFASRPEIARALGGDVVTGTRHSATLGSSFLYVAVPIASGGRILGAVRVTYPTSRLDARVRRYWLVLALIAAVVLAVAAVLGASFARWIKGPLTGLERAAAAVSAGDLAARAPVPDAPAELAALTASFNEMVVKLEALVGSQQEFVADASHELRTPLTALRLRLENLEPHVGEAGRHGLQSALGEIGRLSMVVESLLALARADAGATAVGTIDVAEVARQRVETWTPSARERGVELALVADGPAKARGSAERLQQVLDNLIANALDVAPPGTAITVVAEPDPARITIRDEGPGMSDDEKGRAFDRFWRGHAASGGSGLGLAIVRKLLETDGGTVELRDGPDGGLDAVVTLPRAR
jgi:signal transduction histidine kinase